LAGAQAAARQFISADFAQLAEQTGSLIAPALYGALAASQRLPFSRDQFEATIERSGVGVKTSLKAFAAGFDAAMQVLQPSTSSVADATPVALPLHRQVGPKLKALAQSLEGAFAPAAHEVIASGLTRLADYQDVAYATLYAKRLQEMAGALASSNTATSQAEEILREGARHLALWMSYEDTVRVADLKTRRSRFARVSQEVSLSENPRQPAPWSAVSRKKGAWCKPARCGDFCCCMAWPVCAVSGRCLCVTKPSNNASKSGGRKPCASCPSMPTWPWRCCMRSSWSKATATPTHAAGGILKNS
jgi:hypothetical protein